MTALLWLNAVLGLGSAAFGGVAVVRPSLLVALPRAADLPTTFYARMYAARALPLGIAIAIVTSAAAATHLDRSIVAGWLLVAAAAQAGDILIGGRLRMLGMTAGAGIAFALHLVTALLLLTS